MTCSRVKQSIFDDNLVVRLRQGGFHRDWMKEYTWQEIFFYYHGYHALDEHSSSTLQYSQQTVPERPHTLHLHQTCTWKHQIKNCWHPLLPWPCGWVTESIQLGGDYAALRLTENGQVQVFLNNLVDYTTTIETNLDRRFQEAAPVLEAFSIFDPTCLPNQGNPDFKVYGVDQVGMLCKQFQFDKDHTLAQWLNFKFLMSSWKVPSTVLIGKDDLSPTEFILRKVVNEQVSHHINFPHIVDAAQICLTQPMSNAVVERGASAVKRVKTRLRSCDMYM